MFGLDVKQAILNLSAPSAVENEDELLANLRQKVGPYADVDKLLFFLRISKGKVHWAVNSYFRATLLQPQEGLREDFDVQTAGASASALSSNHGTGSSHVAGNSGTDKAEVLSVGSPAQEQASAAAAADGGADGLGASCSAAVCLVNACPATVWEEILKHVDLVTLCSAGRACKVLDKGVQSECIWEGLFQKRWGDTVFPLNSSSTAAAAAAAAAVVVKQQSTRVPTASARSSIVSHATASTTSASARSSSSSSGSSSLATKPCHGAPGSMQSQLHVPGEASSSHLSSAVVEPTVANDTSSAAAVEPTLSYTSAAGAESTLSHSSLAASTMDGSQDTSKPNLNLSTDRPVADTVQAAAGSSVHDMTPSPCSTSVPQQRAGALTSLPLHSSLQQCPEPVADETAWPVGLRRCIKPPGRYWHQLYKQQHNYQTTRLCPRCGVCSVVPIVYGFPSAQLLAGMQGGRLMLGGDHLIESCHVWACSGCRSCYRYYPYGDVALWLHDDDGGGVVRVIQADGTDAAFPKYTYEL
eukprot:jgi/Chrzof1/3847/Cz13g11010.t1